METAKVLVLQSFFDISVKYTGSIDNAYEIAKANNREVTDDLIVGETLMIPDGLTLSTKEIQYYQARNLLPATGITKADSDIVNPSLGIGSMVIESTFIIR